MLKLWIALFFYLQEVVNMRESLADFCRRTGREELLDEWDSERNLPLTPESVSYGSKRHVWWRCANGHSWQAAVHTRSGSGTGCPYCNGRRPIPGETDLATRYPDIASQWHPTKNGDLTPSDVLPGSHRLIWWQCEHGHVWRAQVKSRVSGSGCPVCSNRTLLRGENDLATNNPELARQWHPTKNGDLTPSDVVPGTRRKVWWVCDKGHEWRAAVSARVNGSGCPVCTSKTIIPGENDLASQYPAVAAQWHPTKNGTLTPEQVAPASNKKVWWICDKGHEYQATIASRTQRGGGCPYCANTKVLPGFNDLATKYPSVAAEWHPTKNAPLTPDHVLPGSRRKVWWQCKNGHSWQAVIYSRTGSQNSGCPFCTGYANGKRRARYERYLAEDDKHE